MASHQALSMTVENMVLCSPLHISCPTPRRWAWPERAELPRWRHGHPPCWSGFPAPCVFWLVRSNTCKLQHRLRSSCYNDSNWWMNILKNESFAILNLILKNKFKKKKFNQNHKVMKLANACLQSTVLTLLWDTTKFRTKRKQHLAVVWAKNMVVMGIKLKQKNVHAFCYTKDLD